MVGVQLAWVLFLLHTAVCHSPEVCINSGCIRGTRMSGINSGDFEAFFGIPYAQPPIGALRFSNPLPEKNWSHFLDATKPKSDCIQKNYLIPNPTVSGSEDCLYLNVYRQKDIKKGILLPVMVYIHGGGFFSGSISPGIHGPEYFMDKKGVILVMMAYRLGAMGFMSTNDSSCPGNFGLKDQVLALKWVQANIEEFGGDKSQVTIFGQSAGGASVHMHMLSEASNGLFHRAIAMSGNAIAPYNEPTKDPLDLARRQAEFVGIKNASSLTTKDLIAKLRTVSASKIVDSGDYLHHWDVDPLVTFRIVVEPKGNGAFLTEHPLSILKSGKYEKVPWMTGVVPVEGAVRAAAIVSNKTLLKDFNEQLDDLLPKLMEIEYDTKEGKQMLLSELRNYYLNGSIELNENNKHGFIKMFTDRAFLHPLQKTLEIYNDGGNSTDPPVYFYKFNYRGNFSYSILFTGTLDNFGIVHCDDLLYLFRTPLIFKDFQEGSTDEEMSKLMVSTYINFAYGRDPHYSGSMVPCTGPTQDAFCTYMEMTSVNNTAVIVYNNQSIYDQKAENMWNDLILCMEQSLPECVQL